MRDDYTEATLISPHNSNELARHSSALYVGGAGTLSVVMSNTRNSNTALSFTVPAGTVLPIRVKRVNATGTTATNIIALY
jgi:hypothetical protein